MVGLADSRPRSAANQVRLSDLATERWIEGCHPDCLGPIPDFTAALGCQPRIGCVCDDWNGMQGLVAAGAGAMLFRAIAAPARRRGISLLQPVPALPPRGVYAATLAARYRFPAITATLSAMVAIGRPLRSGHDDQVYVAGLQVPTSGAAGSSQLRGTLCVEASERAMLPWSVEA